MNVGLFAMLAGFLLPSALVARLAVLLVGERWRGWGHPLVLVLLTEVLLAIVPVIALTPSVWLVVSGNTIEDGALLLDFTASRWGLAKLAANVAGVLLADIAMPRVCAQLINEPVSDACPTWRYLARDLGVLAVCLLVAVTAALVR